MSKPLSREVKISFNKDFKVILKKHDRGEFLPYYSEEDYRKSFIESFTLSLNGDKVVVDDMNPEYDVTIDLLEIEEKVTTDTVKNVNSIDNGKVFEIKRGYLTAKGSIKKNVGGTPNSWSADKSKSERITVGRSAGQVVTNQSNEENRYRKVAFDHNEFYVLAGNCGRRSATVITNSIKRMMRK